jgi:hypothetical protein
MLRRAAVFVAFAGLFVLVFELTARVEDLIRYGTPIFSPYTSQMDLIVRDEHGARGRPNGRFQKWVLNDLGTRGPDVQRAKPPGTLRVVTTGASETFGLYESTDREYPRQLEDSLRVSVAQVSCPETSAIDRVEVINAALPGMSLPTVALDVKYRIAALAPDFVVFYPTPPQYLDEKPPGSVAPRPQGGADPPALRAFYPRSTGRLRNQLKTILPAFVQTALRRREVEKVRRDKPEGWRFTAVPPERLQLFERHLREMVGIIRATGASPVLATNTNAFLGDEPASADMLFAWERFYPRATGDVILAFDSSARAIIRQVARDSMTALADIEPAVRSSAAFADFSHFTDAGAASVAGVLARTILAEAERTRCGSVPPSSAGRIAQVQTR